MYGASEYYIKLYYKSTIYLQLTNFYWKRNPFYLANYKK